jgi:uncharacterized cofD-like protein
MSNIKKHIVTIGGGNGSAITLQALKPFSDSIRLSAVISMSDSGGSSGRLRTEFGALPPGDIMRATLALSSYDYETLKRIFYKTRFSGAGKMNEHNLGNLFLTLSEQYDGSFSDALRALHEAVDAVGTAHPITLDSSDLCVELSNGDIVMGEHEIDRPTYNRSLRIKRAWLQPTPMIYPPAMDAIKEADVMFLGPGSFYCSVVAPLVVEGMRDAIRESNARLVYIPGNAYEVDGETGPTRLSEAIRELETFLPRPLDAVVYNTHMLSDAERDRYEKKHWGVIEYDRERCGDTPIIEVDYERRGGGLDPERLGQALNTHFLL